MGTCMGVHGSLQVVFMARVRVPGELSFSLHAELPHRAQHARRHRAPNREQHCKQQKEAEAKRLHSN